MCELVLLSHFHIEIAFHSAMATLEEMKGIQHIAKVNIDTSSYDKIFLRCDDRIYRESWVFTTSNLANR
jgi:hypothetical protein